jgi:SAM-dependent methyltransferase
MSLIIDFGNVALAGAFLRVDQFKDEKKYPLQLYFCRDCYLLQIVNKISPEVLFKNYFYFSSAIGTLRDHFANYAEEVTSRFLTPDKSTVVEIGCNDGVLLRPFSRLGIKNIIGVDPSVNAVEAIKDGRIVIINDFFNASTAKSIKDKFGCANLIAGNNVFAHIDDIRGAAKVVQSLLKDDGVFIFEVHYIKNLIEENQYDMIYHEHLYYYSLLALEKFFAGYNMEVFDVKQIPIHAGSMRYYVRKKGGLPKETVSKEVIRIRTDEIKLGYNTVTTFLAYADRINKEKQDLMGLLKSLKKSSKVIFGYGASGRANTIIQYCGISADILDCIIDDAPAKHGFYMPGSHFLIKSRDFLGNNRPDYILLFAWSFLKEIVDKNMDYLHEGGKIIIPLPEVKIISWSGGKMVEELYADFMSKI